MLESDMLMATAGAAGSAAWAAPSPDEADLDLRQLRHHTKNALQRISALVATAPGLKATVAGRQLAEEVERRICLAAKASDALFGLTRAPGTLEGRLRLLSESVAELLADSDQVIRIEVACTGTCPAALQDVVLRAVQELVGNAVKHGFYARLVGRVRVDLASGPRGTTLVVADDGWGLCRRPGDGQGLGLVRALIAPHGGALALRSGDGVTAEMVLPSAVLDSRVAASARQRGREAA
jgi:two-component sensor histidine kinase